MRCVADKIYMEALAFFSGLATGFTCGQVIYSARNVGRTQLSLEWNDGIRAFILMLELLRLSFLLIGLFFSGAEGF